MSWGMCGEVAHRMARQMARPAKRGRPSASSCFLTWDRFPSAPISIFALYCRPSCIVNAKYCSVSHLGLPMSMSRSRSRSTEIALLQLEGTRLA